MSPHYRILALLFLATTLAACGGGGGGGSPDPAGGGGSGEPGLSIDDVSLNEGDAAVQDLVFTVTLSAAASGNVSVDYTTIDGAADASDYTPVSGTLTVSAGTTSATISVPVAGDTEIEADETFSLQLTNPVSATLARSQGVATIVNDDFPLLSIAAVSLIEGDAGVTSMDFEITLDLPGLGDISVDYAASDAAAVTGDDYTAVTGTATIAEGDVAAGFSIDIIGDTNVEPDELFVVNLLNASPNARIAVDEATGLIVNDDFPKVSLGPAGITEADSDTRTLALPIFLDAPATEELTVTYTTGDVTAVAGEDYAAARTTLTIPAGADSATVPIETFGDTTVEPNEGFQVTLSELQGPAVLDQPIALATLLDNDGPGDEPTLYLQPAGVIEGDTGTTQLRFLFLLNTALSEDLTFEASTAPLTASSGVDYEDVSTTLTIPAGTTSVLLPVTVNGDTEREDDESLSMTIGNVTPAVAVPASVILGTIADDDDPASEEQPQLTILDAAAVEGDSGTTDLVFAVTLDEAATSIVTADFATEDGSALAGADYNAASGQISLPVGTTNATITVSAIGDTFSEDDESFRVRLTNLTGGAEFARSIATGTIQTDEPLVRLSVADTGGEEGNTDNTEQVFSVVLDRPALNAVSFDFATADGTALAGEDYLAANGSLQILPGETRIDIPVTVLADTDNEPDETYELSLSNISTNAVVTGALALGTIVNDDGTPGWQTPTTLGAGFSFHSLSMSANGDAAVVFPGPTNIATFENDVLVTRFSGGAWQTPEPVGALRIMPERAPRVAMLDNGRILAAWVTAGSVDSSLYTPGGSWVEQSAGGEGGFFLDLAGNAAGDAALAWESSRNNFDPADILRNRFDGSTATWGAYEFGEMDDTGDAREPMIDIDAAGNIFIYWRQTFSDPALNGKYFDYYDVLSASWRGATLIPELAFAGNEYVAMLSDGRPAVFGQFGDQSQEVVELWVYDPTAGSWASLGSVQASAGEDAVLPKFAESGDGTIFAAWFLQVETAVYDVYANRYDGAAGTWGEPVLLENVEGSANPLSSGLGIAADDNGNAIVVWSQNIAPPGEFDSRIRASRYTASDGLWSPPEQIDDDDLNDTALEPHIGMDSAGNALVIWYYNNIDEIGATRYIAP
ncbi:MAG: Calx-beta domain-containing protein [Pseudomonadota bacterium]